MAEHVPLVESAKALLGELHGFRSHVRPGPVAHQQHDDFAERALSLEIYLSSALRLWSEHEYPPSFTVLRAALEHQLVDRLLFLGRRYRRDYRGVSKSDFEQLEADWKQKKPGTEDIVKVEWKGRGNVAVVRTGLHFSGGKKGPAAPALSIYYAFLQEFDPFVGRPKEQAHLERGFTPVELRIAHAQEQQIIYQRLRWEVIKSNLAENRLCSAETLKRFEVHYRFLSAFVHPVPAAYDLVYGRNRPTGAPRYDHYASELVLLYINKIASDELKALKRIAGRVPKLRLDNWSAVERRVQIADGLAAHLWFPGDPPHAFDFVAEANSRVGGRGKLVPVGGRHPTPGELKPRQVRYYRNPLRRIIEMHRSFTELTTGFSYVSPWPRADAQFR